MIYFLGVRLEENKSISYALCKILGVGKNISKSICHFIGVHPSCPLNCLSDQQVSILFHNLEDRYLLEGELRKKQANEIKRLMDIKSYRGIRHSMGLPLRGQRTRSNGKIQKFIGKKRARFL